MKNAVKEQFGLHTYWQKYGCICRPFWDWISFTRSMKQNQTSIAKYLEYNLIILCTDFIVPLSDNKWLQEKLCYIIPGYFLVTTLKRMTRWYISNLKTNTAKEDPSLDFSLKNTWNKKRSFGRNKTMYR